MANTNKNKFSFRRAGRYLTSLAILGAATAALVVMSMSRKAPEESDDAGGKQIVEVFNAVDFDGQLEINVSGMVDPHREIEIAAQVSGEVKEKFPVCRAGNYVDADTPLLKIDSTNYDLTYDRLAAEKAQAEANIVELNQELANLDLSLELAQKEFDLQKTEYKRKEKAGTALSPSELDQAMRALTSAERSLTELRNTRRLSETRRTRLQTGIELSDVRLKEAQLNKDRCIIKAPFDGVIVMDPVEQGDYVATGTTLVVLEDIDKTDVKCNLRFEQLLKIVKYHKTGDSRSLIPTSAYELPETPVTIHRDRGDGFVVSWKGNLSRYDGIGVDSATKMIPCRIVVDDPVTMENGQHKALVRGMFVKVTIPLNVAPDKGKSLLMFPTIAIRPGDFVWSAVDGKLKKHKVQVLERKYRDKPERERRVVVSVNSSELSAGAEIVTNPLPVAQTGTEVEHQPWVSEVNSEAGSDQPVDTQPSSMPESGTNSPTTTSTSTSAEDTEPANARTDKGTIRS